MRCLAFNPFTTAPVEGTHYAYAPTFGRPAAGDQTMYQLARTYQFSVRMSF